MNDSERGMNSPGAPGRGGKAIPSGRTRTSFHVQARRLGDFDARLKFSRSHAFLMSASNVDFRVLERPDGVERCGEEICTEPS